MDGKMLARVGAIVFVAIAVTATAIEVSRKDDTPENWGTARPTAPAEDPLRGELLRCQGLGEAGPRDPACLRAWADSRRRFLTPGTTGLQAGSGLPGSSAESPSRGAAPGGE